MEAKELAARLNARKQGAGWSAKCPAHDDKRESLSIGESNGRLLLRCHAGCTFDEILAAVAPSTATNGQRRVVAEYEYRDENGALLYSVVRFEPKDFRVKRADGQWTVAGVRRVPYRLPALLEALGTAYIVEGEKDADNLASLGLCATTIAGGAQANLPDGFARYFTGVELVVVLPDNDDPGREFASRIATALQESGTHVKVVALPNVPAKGDVSEWLGNGGTAEELGRLVEAAGLCGTEPRVSPYAQNLKQVEGELREFLEAPASQFIRHPWPDLDKIVGGMLHGEVHYVGAFSGNGKTLFMLSLALEWIKRGIGVYYVGLESGQMPLYANLLCMGEGIKSAEILTGRAWERTDWGEIKRRMYERAAKFREYPLYLAPAPRIDLAALRNCFEEASRMDASVLMVDHVDHLGTGDNRDLYNESVAVNNALKDYADSSRMLVVASTQFNLEAVRNDPLDKFLPPREHYVKMGNHKREIATSMLGLYRPIRQNVTEDELKEVRRKFRSPRDILEPWQMAVLQMKARKDGEGEGQRCVLSTEGYHVSHLPERDRFSSTYDGVRAI